MSGEGAEMVVFLGPTLAAAEAERLCPGATIVPPAKAGDVYARARRMGAGSGLALVDGYFEHTAAVWHKELLFAMERGIRVYGAASMGALRAAELAPFGMIAVGAIARAYARGRIVRDDEVAVAHGPAEMGYPVVSEALVNVRFALAEAVRARIVAADVAERLLGSAGEQFFRERTWASVLAAGRADGVSAKVLAALASWLRERQPNQKREDAEKLLRRLARERADAPRRERRDWTLSRTWFFEQLVAGVGQGPAVEAGRPQRRSRPVGSGRQGRAKTQGK